MKKISLFLLLIAAASAPAQKPKKPCSRPVSGQCAVFDSSFDCGYRWGSCAPAQHVVLKGLPPFTMVHVVACEKEHKFLAIYSDGEMTLPAANPVLGTGDGEAYFYLPPSECMEIRLAYGGWEQNVK